MKIHAYVLAADPCWIEAGVLSWYEIADKIIISHDRDLRSYTGTNDMPIAECLERLRLIDRDKKMVFSPGDYGRGDFSTMENETHQRRCALQEAGQGADWVLQLDTDEVLPNVQSLLRVLDEAQKQGIEAVEWPMRVLYRRLNDGRFLEVCEVSGTPRFEYPGPICVRPDVTIAHARRVEGLYLRPVVVGDNYSLQVVQAQEANERRIPLENGADAVLHNSWARSEKSIQLKIKTWSHSDGWKSQIYYYRYWWLSKYWWRSMRDFHPLVRNLWPALQPVEKWPECISLENAQKTG